MEGGRLALPGPGGYINAEFPDSFGPHVAPLWARNFEDLQ